MSAGHKHTYVGQFFEHVGHAIFGGLLTRDERGDVFLPKSRISIEVKGSSRDSSYGFRLSVDQVADYEFQNLDGLSRDSWYVLFSYRNRAVFSKKHGRRLTELSTHTTLESISTYLSSAVLRGVLLDLSIISRWKEELPKQRKSIMGHLGMVTVDVKCRRLEEVLSSGLSIHLTEIGLQPANYRRVTFVPCVQFAVGTNAHRVTVPMTAIVTKGRASSLTRMLRRRGFVVSCESL